MIKKNKLLFSIVLVLVFCTAFGMTAIKAQAEDFDPNVTFAENTNFAWSLDTDEDSEAKGTLTFSFNNNDVQLYWDNRSAYPEQYEIYNNFQAWKEIWNNKVTRIVVKGFSDNAVRVQGGISFFANWNELTSVRIELVDNNKTWSFRNFWMSGGWFQGCPKLTTVSIGGAENAGSVNLSGWGRYYRTFSNMFRNCSSVTTVILPEALADQESGKTYETAAGIHDYMFLGASSLENITIPSWAGSVGTGAFSGNTSLKNITIPGTVKTIGTSAFSSTTVSKVSYSACTALENVIIEDGVEKIGTNAFKNCVNLAGTSFTVGDKAEDGTQTVATGLVIPASVETVSAGAFAGTNVSAVKLLNADTAVESDAFPVNTVIYSPSEKQTESLKAKGYNAVYYAETVSTGLQHLPSDNSVTMYSWKLDTSGTLTITANGYDIITNNGYTNFKIWRSSIDNSLVKKIVVNGTTQYGKILCQHFTNILSNWPEVEIIHLGECITKLDNGWTGTGIFQNNPKLTTVYSDKAPEYNAVGNINLAGLITISQDTTNYVITPKMFYNDASFTSVTLPGWVTTIGANAFFGCESLTYIEIPAAVKSIGATAFSESGIINIKMLRSDVNGFTMDITAFDDTSIVKVGVSSDEMKELLVGTHGFKADNVSVIKGGSFASGSLNWEIVGGILSITGNGTDFAFDTEITQNNLSAIPWASESENIEKVVIGADITSVCDYAFATLKKCTSVEIPETLTGFDASSVFYGSESIRSVYVTGKEEKEGVFDLFNAAKVSSNLFKGFNADVNVYLPKLTDTSYLDTWSEDTEKLTVTTYPTSALATAVRAKDDISIAYLPESYDSTLTRSGATTVGSKFSWTYDDATETVKVSGTLSVTAANRDEWYAWRNIWSDAIVHFRLDEGITYLYNNNGMIFKNLKNLVSVHFETEKNVYLRNFGWGYGYFNGCSSLTTISMGADDTVDGVIDLSRWTTSQYQFTDMFEGCSSITKVILPKILTNVDGSNAKIDTLISEGMFNGCSALREIVIPDCFVGIGANAFKNCSLLEKIVILNPDFSFASANAATLPANKKLEIYVTSEKVKREIEALGIADFTIHNVGGAISAEGYSIRLTEYNGLCASFVFDENKNEAVKALGLTLKEYGAIICPASEYDYWGGVELKNLNGAYIPKASAMKKLTVFNGSKYTEYDGDDYSVKIINNAGDNKTYFDAAVIKLNNGFKDDFYMTGYAVYTDADGNDYYVYANYGDTNEEYKFVNLYQATLDMYKNDEVTSDADEVAVWNTILQGAVEGYSECATSLDGVTVTVVGDETANYAFVRKENGIALTEEEIEAAMAEVNFEGEISEIFGVSIADMGTIPPQDIAPAELNSTVSTPNRYNRSVGKAQHQQGMCTDGEYIYYSFTTRVVKVRMSDGIEVGSVIIDDDINQYNPHMGNIIYHNGKLYGSLSMWGSEKCYIAVINADDIVGNVSTADIMQGAYYADDDLITLFDGTENETADRMHGGMGIDSITVGKLPGEGFVLPDGTELEDDKDYIVFGAGSKYQHPTKRHDDDYLILRFVDLDDIEKNAAPINSARIEGEETPIASKYKTYAYAGSTGVQCIAYDKDTGDYHLATYGRDKGIDDTYPKYDYFVIDGSQKLRLTEIYVGQNTPADSEVYDISVERAAQYKDAGDLDRDGDTAEQMLGWTANLRCVCGKDSIHAHDAVDYDNSGYAGKICGMAHPGMADQGIISMGNDYFYVAYYNDEVIDGDTYYGSHAMLYRLRRYNSAWTFKRVQ